MSYEEIGLEQKETRLGYKEMSLKQRAEHFGIATDFPSSRERRRSDLKMAVREERRRKKRIEK